MYMYVYNVYVYVCIVCVYVYVCVCIVCVYVCVYVRVQTLPSGDLCWMTALQCSTRRGVSNICMVST